MAGITEDNFEVLKNNLKKAIAESLGVDVDTIQLELESGVLGKKRTTRSQSTIKVIIEVTEQTNTGDVLDTANDATSFTTSLTTTMKKNNISEDIGITEISKPLVLQRKKLNLQITILLWLHYHFVAFYNYQNPLTKTPFAAVHCEWGEWVSGACSESCGDGIITKTRIKKVNESDGGECSGNHTDFLPCKGNECPGR